MGGCRPCWKSALTMPPMSTLVFDDVLKCDISALVGDREYVVAANMALLHQQRDIVAFPGSASPAAFDDADDAIRSGGAHRGSRWRDEFAVGWQRSFMARRASSAS